MRGGSLADRLALRYRDRRRNRPLRPGTFRWAKRPQLGKFYGVKHARRRFSRRQVENIGHGFTGVPTLAFSSLTATLFTFLGAWAGNYWRFARPQRIKLHGTRNRRV